MPTLRKDDSMVATIREIFDELKHEFITTIQESLLLSLEDKVQQAVQAAVKELVGKNEQEIIILDSQVQMLQKQVTELKLHNIFQSEKCDTDNQNVLKKCEENEQYGRRLCLRIEGIKPAESDETSSDVFDKVRDLIKEHAPEIPDDVIDRAHRIGPVFETKDKVKKQNIIVRFTTFRHRTILYQKRKSIENISIRLDLTKERYVMLMSAREMVEENENVKFVYADINCRLKIRFASGIVKPFQSLEDLAMLLDEGDVE